MCRLHAPMDYYFTQQESIGRRYTKRDKSEIFMIRLDNKYYDAAIDKLLLHVAIAAIHGDDKISHQAYTFTRLPATVKYITSIVHHEIQQLLQKALKQTEIKNLRINLRYLLQKHQRKRIGQDKKRKRIGFQRMRIGPISSNNLRVIFDIFQRDHLNKDIDKMSTSPKTALTVFQNIYSRDRLNKHIDKYLFDVFQRDKLNKNIDKDKHDENPPHLVPQTKQ